MGSFPAGRQPGPRIGMDARPAATQGWVANSGSVQKKDGLRALAAGTIGIRGPKGRPGLTPSWLAANPGKRHAQGQGRGSGGPPGRRVSETTREHSGPRGAVFPKSAWACWGSGHEGREDERTGHWERALGHADAASRALSALSNQGRGVPRPPIPHGRGIFRVHGPPWPRHLAHPGAARGTRRTGTGARPVGEQFSGPPAVGGPGPGPCPEAIRLGGSFPHGRRTGSGAAGRPAAAGPGSWRRPAQAGRGKRGGAQGRRGLQGHHAQGSCAGAAAGPAARGGGGPAERAGWRSAGSDGSAGCADGRRGGGAQAAPSPAENTEREAEPGM